MSEHTPIAWVCHISYLLSPRLFVESSEVTEDQHIKARCLTNSLLAKLDAAQAALDRGQTSVAINNLQAFILEVQAQAGKHIEQVHAGHLVEHAQMVIQNLENG